MDSLLKHGDQIVQGLCTPTQFQSFSIKTLIHEIRSNAPDVYQLFLCLGKTNRNHTGEGTSLEERKAIISLCTLLNARQRMANGLQLLLTFMLIAHATSKQVSNISVHV